MSEPTRPVTEPTDAESERTEAEGQPATAEAPAEEAAPPRAETTGSPDTPDAPKTPDAPDTLDVVETPDAPDASDVATPPAAEAAPAPVAPRPTPGTTPRPTPRAIPRPPSASAPRPAPRPGRTVPAPHPAAPSAHDAYEAAQAAAWGRVDADGTVWVREAAGERSVGQYPGADTSEALGFYVRRYLDLQAQVALLEVRLAQIPVKDAEQTLAGLNDALLAPAAVGDLDGLRARVAALAEQIDARRAEAAAERETARAEALAARTALVEEAERIVETEPSRMQWRQAGDRLRELLEDWKSAQRHGPRLDRANEDSLWKRFSHARSSFDRARRQYFAELEQQRAQARGEKETIVVEAERLATSTDWGTTAAAYRSLMDRWKAAGRAPQREDDALWARFRTAQDAFFAARNAAGSATDAEYAANLEAKLALLDEAEALLPLKDLGQAKAALRSIQDRWDAAGKVPRGDVQRVEARLRAVEQAVRDAEQRAWSRSNPETRARAQGAAAQLEAAIAGLEADLAAAKAAGKPGAVKDLEAALATRKAWLAQVRRTADDAG